MKNKKEQGMQFKYIGLIVLFLIVLLGVFFLFHSQEHKIIITGENIRYFQGRYLAFDEGEEVSVVFDINFEKEGVIFTYEPLRLTADGRPYEKQQFILEHGEEWKEDVAALAQEIQLADQKRKKEGEAQKFKWDIEIKIDAGNYDYRGIEYPMMWDEFWQKMYQEIKQKYGVQLMKEISWEDCVRIDRNYDTQDTIQQIVIWYRNTPLVEEAEIRMNFEENKIYFSDLIKHQTTIYSCNRIENILEFLKESVLYGKWSGGETDSAFDIPDVQMENGTHLPAWKLTVITEKGKAQIASWGNYPDFWYDLFDKISEETGFTYDQSGTLKRGSNTP